MLPFQHINNKVFRCLPIWVWFDASYMYFVTLCTHVFRSCCLNSSTCTPTRWAHIHLGNTWSQGCPHRNPSTSRTFSPRYTKVSWFLRTKPTMQSCRGQKSAAVMANNGGAVFTSTELIIAGNRRWEIRLADDFFPRQLVPSAMS